MAFYFICFFSSGFLFCFFFFFFSSRRRHTRLTCDWSSDVCSSDLRDEDEWRVKNLFRQLRRRKTAGQQIASRPMFQAAGDELGLCDNRRVVPDHVHFQPVNFRTADKRKSTQMQADASASQSLVPRQSAVAYNAIRKVCASSSVVSMMGFAFMLLAF